MSKDKNDEVVNIANNIAAQRLANKDAWWALGDQGYGVFGSGLEFGDLTTGLQIGGNLFDAWGTYQNNKKLLNAKLANMQYNNENTAANTALLQNRLATLQYNNANSGLNITGNSLMFGSNQPVQSPQASSNVPTIPLPQNPNYNAPMGQQGASNAPLSADAFSKWRRG